MRTKFTVIMLVVFAVVVVVLTVADIGPLPAWLLHAERPIGVRLNVYQQLQIEQAIRTTVLQAIAGVLLISGAIATWRQVSTASQTLILNQTIRATDVFARAIESLASTSSVTRIGAVYTLDRIAREQSDERTRIETLLTAFTRSVPENPLNDIGPDVQAAVDMLTSGQYGTPNLDDARLRGAILVRANLNCASLRRASLNRANLAGADLRNASLVGAILREADLTSADVRGTDFREADLAGAQLEDIRCDDDTKWPSGSDLVH